MVSCSGYAHGLSLIGLSLRHADCRFWRSAVQLRLSARVGVRSFAGCVGFWHRRCAGELPGNQLVKLGFMSCTPGVLVQSRCLQPPQDCFVQSVRASQASELEALRSQLADGHALAAGQQLLRQRSSASAGGVSSGWAASESVGAQAPGSEAQGTSLHRGGCEGAGGSGSSSPSAWPPVGGSALPAADEQLPELAPLPPSLQSAMADVRAARQALEQLQQEQQQQHTSGSSTPGAPVQGGLSSMPQFGNGSIHGLLSSGLGLGLSGSKGSNGSRPASSAANAAAEALSKLNNILPLLSLGGGGGGGVNGNGSINTSGATGDHGVSESYVSCSITFHYSSYIYRTHLLLP
jgi:hypothetical protein